MTLLQKMELLNRIEQALDHVRPSLQTDGGDVEVVDFDPRTGVLRVRLQGTCANCEMADLARKMGIEPLLRARVPEVRAVTLATTPGEGAGAAAAGRRG